MPTNFKIFLLAAASCLALFSALPVSAQEKSAALEKQAGPYRSLVIKNVTVIDGSGAPAFGPVDIVIKGNRIDSIQRADAISRAEAQAGHAEAKPENSPERVLDGRGMYVMPGIIDVHTHVNFEKDVPAEYIYKLLLGHGITTVRAFNLGHLDPQAMAEERKRLLAEHVIAPRLYLYPYWRDNDPAFSTPQGAREIVDRWHALGLDGVKIFGKPGLWPDVFAAISAEARKNGMGLAVHIAQDGVYPMNAVRIAAEGASTIEHHYGYPESSYTGRSIQELPPGYNYSNEADRFLETGRSWLQANLNRLHGEVIDSLLDSSRKSGFIMVPTFNIYEANRDVTRLSNLPWHSTFTLPVVMDSFLPSPSHHASYFFEWTSSKEAEWARAYRRWLDFVNDYKNSGGPVAVGSDSGYLFEIWGFGTIRELEMLEEAGFSPLETIHAATENGARVVKNPELGLIRQGYLADMLLLSENPLADLKVLYGSGVTRVGTDRKASQQFPLKYTIRDGVVFDSQALLRDVRDIVAKAKLAQPTKK